MLFELVEIFTQINLLINKATKMYFMNTDASLGVCVVLPTDSVGSLHNQLSLFMSLHRYLQIHTVKTRFHIL